MRVLLLYPQFPKSFWSFEQALALVGRKALLPPLGLITVAAILPQTWEYRLIDLNIRTVSEFDWKWADLVIISGMIVQKDDLIAQIKEAKKRGKKVAVGGPYPTSVPEDIKAAGADYLVLDEGEITLPMLVEAINQGKPRGIFRANEKPSVTETPVPRYDLLEMDAYDNMSIQFSRGCPFQCEFCDIIVLYGRKPRTKNPDQIIAELERLYELGWRGLIFLVDDNFIGNKRNVKLLLKELKVWLAKYNYPFKFTTEASVDLAEDSELLDLMADCNFNAVFLGIETPDEASLTVTKKYQNTRNSLAEAVQKITKSGLRVMAGFIIGFDGEKPGAGDRIVQFVEETSLPMAMLSMLQALPNTALWHRLEKEGRLINEGTGNQTTLMNFTPTRPLEDIAREYIKAFWELYDPEKYLDRTYRNFLMMSPPRNTVPQRALPNWLTIRALGILVWKQGILRRTRWKFWVNLVGILRHNPQVFTHYLTVCGFFEHFYEYRQIVQDQINSQLEVYLTTKVETEEMYQKAA
jgi:radical SAM superfamily enzyme YgiQ (UPF0313 family)